MNNIRKEPLSDLGKNFIPDEYLPQGKDEYYLRFQQNPDSGKYRHLSAYEIEVLVRNHNTCSDWNHLLVSNAFNPDLVKECKFFGLVRIGNLESCFLEFNDLKMPVGLYNSVIINCDLGNNVVVDNVKYMAYYIIGNEVVINNVHELVTTNHAKFGNGILTEGETEDVRIWLEICNENGGRAIMPFDGMQVSDAWLWSRDRHNNDLQRRYSEMTEKQFNKVRGFYGTIGDRTVIKNCSIIKDVKIGSDAYLKGAHKLKNLTINSSPEAHTQIGEGCELVNGIIGQGCRVFYGVKAVRFIIGQNAQLKYGARLINSYLGDNSTISCCEVLNSLIFPAHEQHHNNSFLIAATIGGQSNIAAGATLGSNHNSRAADGELIAGRGFWPGLCTSLKFNSRFAPFTILAKGDYPYELDIPFPFSLVSNDTAHNQLRILPAYWLMYNLYALQRNSLKYIDRDKRTSKLVYFETNFLAPDTINSIIQSLKLLETFAGEQYLAKEIDQTTNQEDIRSAGRQMLSDTGKSILLHLDHQKFENSKRTVVIMHANEAYRTYLDFIKYYCIDTLCDYLRENPALTISDVIALLSGTYVREEFENVGGQLISAGNLSEFKNKIIAYEIISWQQVHEFFEKQSGLYSKQKLSHSLACLKELFLKVTPTPEEVGHLLAWYIEFSHNLFNKIELSRQKDYDNPFRSMLYADDKEMEAVMGRLDKTPFLQKQKLKIDSDCDFVQSFIHKWEL